MVGIKDTTVVDGDPSPAAHAPVDSFSSETFSRYGITDHVDTQFRIQVRDSLHAEVEKAFHDLGGSTDMRSVHVDFADREGGYSIRLDSDGEFRIFGRLGTEGFTLSDVLTGERTNIIPGEQQIAPDATFFTLVDQQVFPLRHLFDVARADILFVDASGAETLAHEVSISRNVFDSNQPYEISFANDGAAVNINEEGMEIRSVFLPIAKVTDPISLDTHRIATTLLPMGSPFDTPNAYQGRVLDITYEFADEPGNRMGSRPVVLEKVSRNSGEEKETVLTFRSLDNNREIILRESAHNIVGVKYADHHSEISPLLGSDKEAFAHMKELGEVFRKEHHTSSSGRIGYLTRNFFLGSPVEVSFTRTYEKPVRGGKPETITTQEQVRGTFEGVEYLRDNKKDPALIYSSASGQRFAIPIEAIDRVTALEPPSGSRHIWARKSGD